MCLKIKIKMNFLQKLICSLYKYYSKGATHSIPYEKSIFALFGIFLLNIFSIWVIATPYCPNCSFTNDSNKLTRILALSIIFVIYYIVMRIILPEKKIQKIEFVNSKLYVRGFFIYALLTYLLFVFSVLFKSGKL